MVVRRILLLLCFFSLLLPLYAKDNPKLLYISGIEYIGSDKNISKIVTDMVKDELLAYGMFEIIKSRNEAEYILSCLIQEKNDETIVSIQISGILSNTIKEEVLKRDSPGSDITILLREIVVYIHEKIFPFEMYTVQNMPFFSATKMRAFYNKDAIDRTRQDSYIGRISAELPKRIRILFDPLDQELFNDHRFQLFPSCEVSFPVNLLNRRVYQAPQFQIPLHFYLFTTRTIMFNLQIEINYIPLRIQLPENIDKYNELNIIEFGGGAGVCFPLPFYESLGLHLNLSGGCAVSIVNSEEYADKTFPSWDPYVHPSFEIEHTITKNLSFSLKCSYIWIITIGEDLHLVQTGIGFGFRF